MYKTYKFKFPATLAFILVPVAILAISLAGSSAALALSDHCSSASRPVADRKTGKVIRCIPLPRQANANRQKNRSVLRLRQKKRDQQALIKRQEINQKRIISERNSRIRQQLTEQAQLNRHRRILGKRQALKLLQPAITKKQKQRFLQSDMPRPLSRDQLRLQLKQKTDQRRTEVIQLQRMLERRKKISREQEQLLKNIQDEQQSR